MTTRKSSFEMEENPAKRQRIVDDSTEPLIALNNDCLMHAASFLPLDDLNTFALVSRRCCEIRNHESLDQTRKATFTCRENQSTRSSLSAALTDASVFLTPNYTHVSIFGLEKTVDEGNPMWLEQPLENVTVLELVGENPNETVSTGTALMLGLFFPNVREVLFKDMNGGFSFRWRGLFAQSSRMELCGGSVPMFVSRNDLPLSSPTDFILDNCHFLVHDIRKDSAPSDERMMQMFADSFSKNGSNFRLLNYCSLVRRLSIKGATWSLSRSAEHLASAKPISQEMLMKMVRHLPALRWLRSDLSEENIAILQQERPNITFVSE